MISKFNWNDFTLKFFLSEIGKVLEDGRVREWPHGNLALLQYAYWEKVQPIIGPKYDPLSLMSPLMRNWTESVAEKRDKYDYDYGRGVRMIDDNITYEYRVKKIAQEQAEKNKKSSTKKSTRMIEKMNKTGVFYRTGNMEEEEENIYDDINESTNDGAFGHKEFFYQSDKDNYRTPSQGKINKQKDNDEDEQVEKGIGKRKRNASRAIKSPFVVVEPIKRAKLSAKAKLFNKLDGKKSSADVDVMNAYSSFLLEEVEDEPDIIPTWRVTWLLEYRNDKNVNGNEYQKVSNSNEPVNRCMNEYFKAPKTYMALNKDNTHWVTVVMHKEKEEVQVLDSLMGKELDSTTRKLVEDLRREIIADIAEANATGSVQYPDVSTWPIKTYDMPQQEDGNSCGLFVLHCFKIGMAIHGIDLFHRHQLMVRGS
ncbi:hypothetical protein D1007_22555 [Hordeum vulgare]|nr:hypothetical protein D1007_22555 [Hordeum vulgare]